MHSRLTWYKAGLLSAGLALFATWFLALSCRSLEPPAVCRIIGSVIAAMSLPARLVADPFLRKVGYLLGTWEARPDVMAAPPGVVAVLSVVWWSVFLVYWFAVGAVIYWLATAFTRGEQLARNS
jgi:hypothetical protein